MKTKWDVYSSVSGAYDAKPGSTGVVGRLAIPPKSEISWQSFVADLNSGMKTYASVLKKLDKLSSDRYLRGECISIYFPISGFAFGYNTLKTWELKARDIQGVFTFEEAEEIYDNLIGFFRFHDLTDSQPSPEVLKRAIKAQPHGEEQLMQSAKVSKTDLEKALNGERIDIRSSARLHKSCKHVTMVLKGYAACYSWIQVHGLE